MIIAIDVPEGTKLNRVGNRVFLTIDASKSKTGLWKAALHLWLVEVKTRGEFYGAPLLSSGRMEVSYKNKLRFQKL